MDKFFTKAGLVACVLVVVGIGIACFVIGRNSKKCPQPQVIHTTDTLRLTEAQKDSLDAVWKRRFVIIKRGMSVSKTDTVRYEDSTQINGLYRLIEALTEQNDQQDDHAIIVPQNTVSVNPERNYKIGTAFGFSTGLTKHSSSISIGPSLGHDKGVISLSAGYSPWDTDKWRGSLAYTWWFR